MLPEVRMARVLDAISSHLAGRLSCVEAGELLGFSERHFRRLRDAYEERGEEGLIDRRRGRASPLRAGEASNACVALDGSDAALSCSRAGTLRNWLSQAWDVSKASIRSRRAASPPQAWSR